MASTEAILALVSGLGGAGIGAGGAIWVQRAKRRDDAAAASLAAERAEAAAVAAAAQAERQAAQAAELAERQAALLAAQAERQAVLVAERSERLAAAAVKKAEDAAALEVLATARSALRAWSTNAERVLGALSSRSDVRAYEYSLQATAEMKELTAALFRIPPQAYLDAAQGEQTATRSFISSVEEVALAVSLMVSSTTPMTDTEIALMLRRVHDTRDHVSRYFLRAVEKVTTTPVPIVLSRIPPGRRRGTTGD
ncbi:hypothetical protein G3I48_32725 [Streptomyces griseus]|uniref:hypothetical protein n=1 Tax=Streptomyces griseus TaxID=1911 RepID=UPI0013B7CED1|nr:hypothetical protein [Streptomyces griseus]